MQDVQNIPNPDVNSTETEDRYGNTSDIERENDSGANDTENIPLPPTELKPAPVEEPPDTEKANIDEPKRKPSEIV
ncbi:MAG TPA: hypothetical protein VGC97_06630 [Pyrinomonadaceae bacterium]|jgi:hypothetical protein